MSAPPVEEKPGRIWGIAVILLLALGLRMGWCLTRPVNDAGIDILPDQRDYLSLAQNLLHGRGLQFYDPRFSQTVWAFRTPGYPLFLAACGASVRAARGVQALVDTSTVGAVFLLAGLVTGQRHRRRVGLVAAALVAVNPFLIYFAGLILSETLFTAILAWGMVLLIRRRGGGDGGGGKSTAWACGAGLLALSVLVRPSAVALPIVLAILAAFINAAGQRRSASGRSVFRAAVRDALTAALLVVVVLLPWGYRNYRALGRWVWLDTNGGFTLYDGFNPTATGASDQRFVEQLAELKGMTEVDRSKYLSHKAIEYARRHPGRVLQLALVKLARTWSPVPLSNEYGRPSYRLIALTYSLPLDVWVVLGLYWGALPRTAKVFLILPAIYFSIVHAFTVGSLRYRVPAEPPMAIVAAGLLAAAGKPRADRR